MAAQRTCPSSADLEKLMTGNLPEPEVEQLAEHLEHCSRCADTVRGLHLSDTLLEAAQASADAGGGSAESAVEQLIQHLKGKHPAAPEVTLDEAVQPPAGMPAGEGAEDVPAFLSVAQGPGELGRLGGYRVLKLLGAGGMGMVYQAEDVHLQRTVALKVMKPDVAKNPTARERFLREARAAAKLKSDHVVTIHQVGEDNQTVFLAMEFLQGLSLDDWLKKDRTPTLTQAARIGRQIALGLADAHACGLIHRDIKPGNIWLDSHHQGRVKLLDFGLARGNAEEIHLTQSGAIVGTPAYMAPEQARGEHVDHRVDLFSLGVVLYRLTTGQLPFRGDNTMSILTSLALDVPRTPREINPDIPPRMATLIERLLAKDREQRPATAKAVADELAAMEREATHPAEGEQTVQVAIGKRQPAGTERPARTSRLTLAVRRWLAVAALLLVLGGAAAAIVVILRDRQGKEVARYTVPEGGSVEVKDGAGGAKDAPPAKEAPAVPVGDADRRAAKWVLSLGGSIHIRAAGKVQEVKAAGDLPAGEWRLESIQLGSKQVSDAGLENLKGLTSLAVLYLHLTQISDGGLEHLKGLTSLELLDLRGTRISDAGLEHLKGLTRLEYLSVDGSRISDAGLEHLKGLTRLKALEVSGMRISDAGLEHLKGLTKLTLLYANNTRISDAGLKHLKQLRKLNILALTNTRVSDAGLSDLTYFPALRLILENTRISAKGFAALKAAYPSAQIDWSEPNRSAAQAVLALGGTVHVRPDGRADDRLVKTAAELPGEYFRVTRVNLAGVTKPLGEPYTKLVRLSDPDFDNLQMLDLSGTLINDSDLPQLKPVTSVTELSLARTAVSDGGLAALKEFKQLTDLSLARTGISDDGLAALKEFKQLRRLVLDGTPIVGFGLEHLKGLPELRELRLGCPSLAQLVLAPRLGELKQLEKLSLAGSAVNDDGLKALHGLDHLRELDLSGTKATEAGIAELRKALPKCKIVFGPAAKVDKP